MANVKRAMVYLQRVMKEDEKPDPVSSLRIAWFVERAVKPDVVWHAYNPAPDPLPKRVEEMWFIASSWAYLDDAFRQQTLKIFQLADRVIWCNNDWAVAFHAYHLGRIREDANLCALTTVKPLAEKFGMSSTFDWNRLTYRTDVTQTYEKYRDRLSRIYFYGSYRPQRVATFDRYFPVIGNRLTLSAANGKDRRRFADRYPTIEVAPRASDVFAELAKYAATVMLEDKYNLKNFVGPPNRFYEALSAGTAMFFEAESIDRWAEYGYDVSRFTIPNNPLEMIDRAPGVARAQRKWNAPHLTNLANDFRDITKRIRRGKEGISGPPIGAKRYL